MNQSAVLMQDPAEDYKIRFVIGLSILNPE
jgi:hypothetical protein